MVIDTVGKDAKRRRGLQRDCASHMTLGCVLVRMVVGEDHA